MTRQMADDGKPSLYEAIAVFDKSASRTTPNAQTEAWAVIRAAVAALQAERDALRAEVDRLLLSVHILEGCRAPSERAAEDAVRFLLDTAPQERAERAESALEALRGQVAELMKFREGGLPTKGWLRDNDQSRRVLHELNELLAIKERMG